MGKMIPDNLLQAAFLMSAIIKRIEQKQMDAKPEAALVEKREPEQPEDQGARKGEESHDEQ